MTTTDNILRVAAFSTVMGLLALVASTEARPSDGRLRAVCVTAGNAATIEARLGPGSAGAMRVDGGNGFTPWAKAETATRGEVTLSIHVADPNTAFILDMRGLARGKIFGGTFEMWNPNQGHPQKVLSTAVSCTVVPDGDPA